MPDYTYLKEEVDKERKKIANIQMAFLRKYAIEKELIFKYVEKQTKKQIEDVIKEYYRNEKKTITGLKRKMFSREFVYMYYVRGCSVYVVNQAKECVEFDYYNEHTYLNFPKWEALATFIRDYNKRHLSENIVISCKRVERGSYEFYSDDRVSSIWSLFVEADLGKL